MKGIWLVSKLKQLHMFGIRNIYHFGSMEFPGITIDANSEATATMTWIMIDNTSKAIESQLWLESNPALCKSKYPICPVNGTHFQTQVRIQILHLSFMNYLSHHVLTNYSIYVNRSYFECHLVVFERHLVVLERYIPYLYFLKLLT